MAEIDGKEITYDESGNMLKMGEKVYTWTNFRCLDTYTDMNTDVKYTYNCDGIRTSKTIDGSKTEYTLLGTKITSQTTDGKTMYFYYDSNDEIFALNYNNKDYFYVKNLQGDILKILDADGETVVEYTYDAWGNCAFDPDSTTNRTLAVNNPFRYRSYYYDKDSKLYFLQSRYYDPSIGRFISSDDISYLGATGTVLSYNMFAYCENNAVNCSDPTGEFAVVNTAILIKFINALANYIHNMNIDVPDYIYGQGNYPTTHMKYGFAHGTGLNKMSYNGCELIAIYNALHLTGQYANLAEIAFWFEANFGQLVGGIFGTAPRLLSAFFLDNGIKYKAYYTYNSFDKEKRSGRVYIISTWNPKVYHGIHTFAVYIREDKLFDTYNFNINKQAKETYKNLSDLTSKYRFIIAYWIK